MTANLWAARPWMGLHGVRAVVWDMDGTLLNTERVIVQSASDALVHWGHAPLPADYAMPNMHGTAAELMVDVLAERSLPLPVGGALAAGQAFEASYAAQPADAAPLYPGVWAWLQAAHAQGVALAVCTNKQSDLAVEGLRAKGLLPLMATVTGRDTYGVAKPAPDPLLHTLAALGVAPHEAVFVGDTHADAACAHAAQVPFVWFTAGFGSTLVQAYPRLHAFADYAQLPPLLEPSPSGH